MTTIKERIAAIQLFMKERDIDVYIVPSNDPHISEYVSAHFQSRTYMTGFTGSAGTAVFTKEFAGLFTDGRYFIQAQQELQGTDIHLFKEGLPGVPTLSEWLYHTLEDGMTLAFDGRMYPNAEVNGIKASLELKNITINPNVDLIEPIWPNRPAMPDGSIYEHPLIYAGKTVIEKIENIKDVMKQKDADTYIVTGLNDIAWLFNIRGTDVTSTPVAYAYALIEKTDVKIYIDAHRLETSVLENFKQSGVTLCPYEDFYPDIETLTDRVIFIDGNKANATIFDKVKNNNRIVDDNDLVYMTKACFNDIELEHMRNAHIKDGVAMVNGLHWFDSVDKATLTELDVQNKLAYYRGLQKDFIEPSFGTISAYGPNAAMAHYATDTNNSPSIKAEGLLLLDSGGHYIDGTTDITRTVAAGPLTEEEITDFTLVLKGHIALAETVFLHGCTGTNLDIIARQPIWQSYKDYKHGTGHSVGYVLSVHEGPARIRMNHIPFILQPGMVITNEPGLYKESSHGIRTENILVVREEIKNEHGTFLSFENITVCPIDKRCLDKSMLTDKEKAWLNDYHAYVYETLSPHLDPEVNQWLKEATSEL